MLLTFAFYLACIVIPLLVGALALVPFRYHFHLSLFIHWLMFSLIVMYIFSRWGIFGVIGGYVGGALGMIMIIPALFINVWGTVCLLASLDIEEPHCLIYLTVYSTFLAMGYSALMLGVYVSVQIRLFENDPATMNSGIIIYTCLLTISPALMAILKGLFNRKLRKHLLRFE